MGLSGLGSWPIWGGEGSLGRGRQERIRRPSEEPKPHQPESAVTDTVRVLDVFCGAGGSSAGAKAAGAEIVSGIDACRVATGTYEANFPDATVVTGRLEDVDLPDLKRPDRPGRSPAGIARVQEPHLRSWRGSAGRAQPGNSPLDHRIRSSVPPAVAGAGERDPHAAVVSLRRTEGRPQTAWLQARRTPSQRIGLRCAPIAPAPVPDWRP